MRRAELVTAARKDLDQVLDAILWAHTDGHYRTNATPEKTPSTGTSRPAPDTDDPDQVPGARYDLGIGNHRARRAWQTAIELLAQAELRLQIAAYRAAPGAGQPLAVRPRWDSTPAELAATIRGAHRRLDVIAGGAPSTIADDQLGAAATALDEAWRKLKSLDGGSTEGHATAEKPCRICAIRPQAEKKGERCHTCAQWFHRNGYERPTKLDEDAVGQARQAQARRRARGEGWGDEAYSAVSTLTPAQWATFPHSPNPEDWDGPAVTGLDVDDPGDRAERAQERRRRLLRDLARIRPTDGA